MLPTNQTSPVPAQRCFIPINIETLAGSSFELLVSPYEQIQFIKRKIERREGIPISHQHLIWKSTELDDESCLHDYKIEAGTTLKLVLAMRGGPVNTKRVPIEESLIRDVSEYIDSSQDDCAISSELLPSSNKNVTFLVLRDGDQLNFFQVIDRGDGTISPLSGSVSNASMYNPHETITVELEREYDEKRQADDRKTKQKMELIRSKLKTHGKKLDILPNRPSSISKQTKSNIIHHHHRRPILVDSSSNLSMNGDNSSTVSSIEPQQHHAQHRVLPYRFSTNSIFSTYNILSTAASGQTDFLQEEDSEDDEDSHDEDDDQPSQIEHQPIIRSTPPPLVSVNSRKQQQLLTSRSFSPSIFYQRKYHYDQDLSKKSHFHSHNQNRTAKNIIGSHDSTTTLLDAYGQKSVNTVMKNSYPSVSLGPVSQETAITTTTATTTTPENDTTSGGTLVDYIHRISPTLHKQQIPIVSTSSPRIISAKMSKHLSKNDESIVTPNVNCTLENQDAEIHSTNDINFNQSRSSPHLDLIDDDVVRSKHGLTSTTTTCKEKSDSYRKQTGDAQSRNETSLSKPIWADDDDQLVLSDEYANGRRTSTGQSISTHHRNSSTNSTVVTPVPTFTSTFKKSTLPSTTQQFFHHRKTIQNEQQQSKTSPRPFLPSTSSKYKRIQPSTHVPTATPTMTTTTIIPSSQQTPLHHTNISSNDLSNNNNGNISNTSESNTEQVILNKRIEMLKTPGTKSIPQSTAPSPSSSSSRIYSPVPSTSKRHFQQQDMKPINATATVPPASSTLIPMDNTKVTIETIGSKTVSALLRQNATIEPVDTSRGVGKHLASLLTTVSKDTTSTKTNNKQSSRDTVIEDRYKLDSKTNTLWSNATNNNSSTVSSSIPSNAATIYNTNKLPPVIVNRKSTSKCFLCKKRTGLATTYQCRCGSSFCSEHRYPEAHACAFDYKAEGKRLIERNNPLVTAPKLPKI